MPRFVLLMLLALPAPAQYITNVRAIASSEQVKGLTAADNLVNDRGLTPSPDDPAQLALTNNLYDAGGCMWHANYLPTGAQDTPLVDFDFGRPVTVAKFRVWNHNANPSRGFDAVTLYASDDAKSWRTIPQKFRFAKAPGKPGSSAKSTRWPPRSPPAISVSGPTAVTAAASPTSPASARFASSPATPRLPPRPHLPRPSVLTRPTPASSTSPAPPTPPRPTAKPTTPPPSSARSTRTRAAAAPSTSPPAPTSSPARSGTSPATATATATSTAPAATRPSSA